MADQTITVLTTLYADICDSVGLYERVGDQCAHDLVEDSMSVMETLALQHNGRVIRTQGDGVMCTFVDPNEALAAARAMQTSHTSQALKIKIGFNHGQAIERDGDVYGDSVNLAARVTSLARSGEILTTEDTVALLSSTERELANLIDRTTVKGKRAPTGIYSISCNTDSQALTMIAQAHVDAAPRAVAQLTLRYGNMSLLLTGNEATVVIGRDSDCDLVVQNDLVSRRHVSIERRRDQFLITDHSTNGTYVSNAHTPPVFLKREATRLVGSGVLSLGAPLGEATDNQVRFEQSSS